MVFGLETSCEQETIKKKYRELVKRYHPDLAKNEEENKDFTNFIIAINEAYETLSNPISRTDYDNLYAIYFQKNHENYSGYQSFHVMDMVSVTLDAWKSMIAYILGESDDDPGDAYEYGPVANDSDLDIHPLAHHSVDGYESGGDERSDLDGDATI
jgi:DnaJ-class molecular chaperone